MDRRIKVLLADGNEEFCGHLKQILEEQNFDVAGIATDGQTACELLTSCQPEVLLLDLMLPRLDGIAVLRHAQTLPHPAAAMVLILGS